MADPLQYHALSCPYGPLTWMDIVPTGLAVLGLAWCLVECLDVPHLLVRWLWPPQSEMRQCCSVRDIVIRLAQYHLYVISSWLKALSDCVFAVGIDSANEENRTVLRSGRHSPVVLGHLSSSLIDLPSLSGEWGLFVPAWLTGDFFSCFCFGLYEHRFAWSLLTQFSHGCLLSHLTFRCLHGQHAVPLYQSAWFSHFESEKVMTITYVADFAMRMDDAVCLFWCQIFNWSLVAHVDISTTRYTVRSNALSLSIHRLPNVVCYVRRSVGFEEVRYLRGGGGFGKIASPKVVTWAGCCLLSTCSFI